MASNRDREELASEETPLLQAEVSGDTIAEPDIAVKDDDSPNQTVGAARAVLIMFSLWGLIFLQASNMSGITTTQGSIAADLDAFSEASWFTSAYLISLSSLSPLGGRLAQIFSPRLLILNASVLFAIGGLVTSQAHTLPVFLLGRCITGCGAAGVLTLSIVLVLELTGKKWRGLFIGILNAGFTSGVSCGAVIAGALLPVTGWRPLFWGQAPLCLLAGVGIYFSIPDSFVAGPGNDAKLSKKLAGIDYLGAVTLTGSLVLVLFGLASQQVEWLPILLGIVTLAIFLLNEFLWAGDPIIPVTVLKSPPILLSCFAQLGFMSARWLVLFFTPQFGIAVRGWTPAVSGTLLISTNTGFALGGLLVGYFHIKRSGSFWAGCILSFIGFAATLFAISQIANTRVPAVWFVVVIFLNGLCTGAALNYTLAHVLHLALPSTHFVVTSLLATFRGFAGSFGTAIGGGVFQRFLKTALTTGFADRGMGNEEGLIRKLLGSPALVQTLQGAEKEVAVQGYATAIKGLFLCGTALAVLMILVQALTGWAAPEEEKKASNVDGGIVNGSQSGERQ